MRYKYKISRLHFDSVNRENIVEYLMQLEGVISVKLFHRTGIVEINCNEMLSEKIEKLPIDFRITDHVIRADSYNRWELEKFGITLNKEFNVDLEIAYEGDYFICLSKNK